MTPQQRADELLTDYRARRNMETTIQTVMGAIMEADEQVAFYEQRIIRLLAAVKAITDDFDDDVIHLYHSELEIIRDRLSRLLDKAEGKLK